MKGDCGGCQPGDCRCGESEPFDAAAMRDKFIEGSTTWRWLDRLVRAEATLAARSGNVPERDASTEEQLRADLMGQRDAYGILLDRANALERANAALREQAQRNLGLLEVCERQGVEAEAMQQRYNEMVEQRDEARYTAKARLT